MHGIENWANIGEGESSYLEFWIVLLIVLITHLRRESQPSDITGAV